ncbi:MAG: DNA repair protein [Candidatus Omnitrophota bacterium]|jgi:DNA repair protein RadC|nr:MAG: DNA repair protein [Candidatus Omnitrophota bacterium]
MPNGELKGHRQRLRERFLNVEESSRQEETLLELLLSFVIPQKDVLPIAKRLIDDFGGLTKVLDAPFEELCKVDGIKTNTATLLKLVDWIRLNHAEKSAISKPIPKPKEVEVTLFDGIEREEDERQPALVVTPKSKNRKIISRRGTELFGKSALKEAIDLLPTLPDTESLDEIQDFLINALHFSAIQTRQRSTQYIIRRMFPKGYADRSLRVFATKFAGKQELQDVCFYRFLKAEPLEIYIIEDLLIPNLGIGKMNRKKLRDYLANRYPDSRSIKDSMFAVIDALKAGGISKADRNNLYFGYREVLIPSFAFILHSEFSEPGMYDINKLESNQFFRAMLWNPDRFLSSLYELRNMGLISKISEIDNFRQFTTKWTLEQLVEQLNAGGNGS